MGQKDYTKLINEYFSAPDAYWENDEFHTLSPFREDQSSGGGFIIERNGSYLDRKLSKAGHVRELLKLQLGEEYDEGILKGKLMKETEFIYRDSSGEEAFRVNRKDFAFDKNVVGLRIIDGKRVWKLDPYTKKGGQLRPLYNHENLEEGPVVIVEGEKCVDALKPIYNNVVTWAFGAQQGSMRLTDWSPLKGRKIILWPDNDSSGWELIKFAQSHFYGHELERVHTDSLGHKEDVADVIADGQNPLTFIEYRTTPVEALPWEARCLEPHHWFEPDTYTDSKGNFKIKQTYHNFRAILSFYNYELMSNKRKLRYEAKMNGSEVPFNQVDAKILDLAVRNGFPKGNLPSYIDLNAEENAYYPVRDWLDELPEWDGYDHITDTFNLMSFDQDEEIYKILFQRWIISAVACNYEKEFRGRGVLVLQGDQSIGKTTFLRKLVPHPAKWFGEGIALDPRNKDDLEKVLGFWICELGELEGTFRKTDVAALKAFISSPGDTFRLAYARRGEYVPRRSVFCGSVNQDEFLPDKTGNTRFWVLPVKKIAYSTNINQAQLWAQVKYLYEGGVQWWLTPEEERALNKENKSWENKSPIEERFYNAFELDVNGAPLQNFTSHSKGWSTTDVLLRMGVEKPTGAERYAISALLKGFNLKPRTTKSKNKGYAPLVLSGENISPTPYDDIK